MRKEDRIRQQQREKSPERPNERTSDDRKDERVRGDASETEKPHRVPHESGRLPLPD